LLKEVKMVHVPRGKFYGSVTVGERGQIVVPIEARTEFKIKQKDKLVVFGFGPGGGLLILKAEVLNQYVSRSLEYLSSLQKVVREVEK